MGVFDLDVSDLDDPAPAPSTTPNVLFQSGPFPAQDDVKKPSFSASRLSKRPQKRKLPYRADVVLEGSRYKGRRVSRDDADMDVETIGLLNGDEDQSDIENMQSTAERSGSDALDSEDGDIVEEDRNNSDVDSDEVDGDEEEDDNEHDEHRWDEQVESEGNETNAVSRLKAEERAVAARLAQAEEKERARAQAVKKQKVCFAIILYSPLCLFCS